MMCRFKFFILTSICILFSLCFTSCNCELSFSLEKGSVGELLFVDFSGSLGPAMLSLFELNDEGSAVGTSEKGYSSVSASTARGSASETFADESLESAIFNPEEISAWLLKSGFSNVKVTAKKNSIKILMQDENCSSILFSSGLLELEEKNGKKKLKTHLDAENLKKFYDSSDEDLCAFLDLFLAPVFNDEDMTAEEYVEMVGTVYGSEVGKEISSSSATIFGIEKNALNYRIADILTGM